MRGPWIVYLMPAQGCRGVCTRDEWERKLATRPDLYTLVRDGIATETEAELFARGKSGDISPRSVKAFRQQDEL
jgi:hypothetical protein